MNGHRVKVLFLIYLLLTGGIGYSQTGKVVGYIRSTRHQLTESVSFANVRITNSNRSCPANLDGYYCIDSVPTGIQEIVATHVCCGMVSRKIEIITNKTLEVDLEFTCQF